MSLQQQARELAESTGRELADEGIAAAVDLIRERIDWRWGTGAPLLALEAEHMVTLLRFMPRGPMETKAIRRARLAWWTNRWLRRSARAWAVDPEFAKQCKICQPDRIPK